MNNRHLLIWLWQSIRGTRGGILLSCVVGIVRIILSLAFVFLCKYIIDIATGVVSGNLYYWMGVLGAIMLLQLIATLSNTRIKECNRIRLANQLQHQLFSVAMISEWNGRDQMHTGDTMSRLSEDVRSVSVAICEHLPMLFLALLQLAAASIAILIMSKELLCLLLVIMPVAVIVSKIYYRRLRMLTNQIRQQEGTIQSHMQEHLLKRILIICLGSTGLASNDLSSYQKELEDSVRQRVLYRTRANLFIRIGFMGGYFVTFCWGAIGIMAGSISYGMMTAFLQLVNQVQIPFVNMSQYLPSIVQSLSSVERLYEIDCQTKNNSILKSSQSTHTEDSAVGLRLEHLYYKYPDSQSLIIDDLSFDFHPGSRTAIIGPTGQGKSTLLRLILGLLKPIAGRIVLYDCQKREIPLTSDLHRHFSYVPQGNSLMSGTVRHNLLLARPEATEEEMRQALHLAAADFILEREEGLDTLCFEQGNGLSEGQAQRIAIARALLQPGRIMLFDEACSSIDNATESIILENILPVLSDRTIIWITHDKSVEEKMDASLSI